MKNRFNHNGFTLLETIAILVIMGIIAVVAVSRIGSNENNLITTADTLTSHLRLAQGRAMNMSITPDTPNVWGIRFTSTTTYYMFYCTTASTCDPAANQVAFPDASSVVMDLTGSGVTVTNGALIIAFDRFGTPYTNATLTNILGNTLTLTLQDSNGRIRTINITPQTGMITL